MHEGAAGVSAVGECALQHGADGDIVMALLEGGIVGLRREDVVNDLPAVAGADQAQVRRRIGRRRGLSGGGEVRFQGLAFHENKIAICPKPGNRNPRHSPPSTSQNGSYDMFDHVSIGVRKIQKSKAFYDAPLKPLGYACLSSGDSSLGYGKRGVGLWVGVSESPVKANPDSGLHLCLVAPTRKSVDDFHKAALAAGGKANGKPVM